MTDEFPLYWQTIRLVYRAETGGWVGKHKSSAWRGMLGHALKSLHLGWYYQIFENKVSPLHPAGRRLRQGPVPYVLVVPDMQNEKIEAGQEIEIFFTLIGKPVELLLQMAPVYQRMGEAWGPDRVRMAWEGFEVLPVMSWSKLQRLPYAGAAVIQLTTPWVNGNSQTPVFEDFASSLAERAGWLSHFFCEGSMPENITAWREEAAQTQTTDRRLSRDETTRYSARQGRKMDIPGWTGKWQVHNITAPLATLLLAGHSIGVGKGAAWGLGQIQTYWLPGHSYHLRESKK
ncbi:MAG: CRISPR system precrRNA processing endoribonuclease RAMP protein Cas6 [Bacteroidia bacterium]